MNVYFIKTNYVKFEKNIKSVSLLISVKYFVFTRFISYSIKSLIYPLDVYLK